MDSETSSQQKSKGRSNNKNARRVWTKNEEETLLNVLEDLVRQGFKQVEGGFKPGYLLEAEKLLSQKLSGTDLRAMPHIESKVKVWKQKYGAICGALGLSGVGWNDSQNMFDCPDDSVWDLLVKRDVNLNGARHKSFPYYVQWCFIFGKDRATGATAEGPGDSVAAMQDDPTLNDVPATNIEDLSTNATQENVVNPGIVKPTGRKRSRAPDTISRDISKMTDAISSFCVENTASLNNIAKRVGYQYDVTEKRERLYGEIGKLNAIKTEDRFRAITLIANDVSKLDIFFTIPDVDKPTWIELLLQGKI